MNIAIPYWTGKSIDTNHIEKAEILLMQMNLVERDGGPPVTNAIDNSVKCTDVAGPHGE